MAKTCLTVRSTFQTVVNSRS